MSARRLTRQEAAAVAAVYDRTYHELSWYARRLFGLDTEAARDAVQETYQAAAQSWDKVGDLGPDEAIGWLKRVCRNKSVDHFRRSVADEHRSRSLELALHLRSPRREHADPGDVIVDQCRERETLALFKASVLAMPPSRQRVVDLFWGHNQTYAEIAAQLGISQGTVRWHVSQARADVRRALGAAQASEVLGEEVSGA